MASQLPSELIFLVSLLGTKLVLTGQSIIPNLSSKGVLLAKYVFIAQLVCDVPLYQSPSTFASSRSVGIPNNRLRSIIILVVPPVSSFVWGREQELAFAFRNRGPPT